MDEMKSRMDHYVLQHSAAAEKIQKCILVWFLLVILNYHCIFLHIFTMSFTIFLIINSQIWQQHYIPCTHS